MRHAGVMRAPPLGVCVEHGVVVGRPGVHLDAVCLAKLLEGPLDLGNEDSFKA